MFYTLLIVVFVPSIIIYNYVQMTQIHDIPSLTLVADLIERIIILFILFICISMQLGDHVQQVFIILTV